MMPWIVTMVAGFFGKTVNPQYKKLKPILKRQARIGRYTEVYYVGGFEYTDRNYQTFQNRKKFLLEFLKEVHYNAQEDNVEIYLVRNESDAFLMVILDPVEVFENERILTLEKSEYTIDLSRLELIYRR